MALRVTIGAMGPQGKSAIARALENAAQRKVQQQLKVFETIFKEEWVSDINGAGLGTSRPGTSRDRVTPLREAAKLTFPKKTFDMIGEVEVAPDAKPKVEALSGERSAHTISAVNVPNLIFPGTNAWAGKTIVRPSVNWKPAKGGFLIHPKLVLERAKRRWLATFPR
jgi:hypothetical protein